jgi:hypothetical protein
VNWKCRDLGYLQTTGHSAAKISEIKAIFVDLTSQIRLSSPGDLISGLGQPFRKQTYFKESYRKDWHFTCDIPKENFKSFNERRDVHS